MPVASTTFSTYSALFVLLSMLFMATGSDNTFFIVYLDLTIQMAGDCGEGQCDISFAELHLPRDFRQGY